MSRIGRKPIEVPSGVKSTWIILKLRLKDRKVRFPVRFIKI